MYLDFWFPGQPLETITSIHTGKKKIADLGAWVAQRVKYLPDPQALGLSPWLGSMLSRKLPLSLQLPLPVRSLPLSLSLSLQERKKIADQAEKQQLSLDPSEN